MIRVITFGNTKVWLFIQQLHRHKDNNKGDLSPASKFLCYFKFTEPSLMSFGELILDPAKKLPVIFASQDAAESFAQKFIAGRFGLKNN